MEDKQTYLLLGNYRPTVTLARTYGRAGGKVIVTHGGHEGMAQLSRYVSEMWNEPDPANGEAAFISALTDYLAARPDIGIIVPVTERYAIAVARHAAALPADRLVAAPQPDIVLSMLDKPSLFECVRDLGVPIAPFRRISDYAALLAAIEEIGLPIVLRPLRSEVRLNGNKALTISSLSELEAELPAWPADHASLLAQRRVSGLRHNYYFAANKGEIFRSVETRIIETDHTDGSGLATIGETIETTPDIARHTETILRAVGYHGIGCAQYLVDGDTGAINFLEINPRVAGNHAVPEAAGLELGLMAVRLARGDPDPGPVRAGKTGLRYSWTNGAIWALKLQLASGEVSYRQVPARLLGIFGTFLKSDVHMTWSLRDPAPTLAQATKQIVRTLVGHGNGLTDGSEPLKAK